MPDILSSTYLADFAAEKVIAALFSAAVKQNVAFAAWRNPGEEIIYISIAAKAEPIAENFQIESAPDGFIIHPFTVSEQNKAYFLKAGIVFTFNNSTSEITAEKLQETPEIQLFLEVFQQQLKTPDQEIKWFTGNSALKTATRNDYENLVKNAIEFIKKSQAEKIVPSRTAFKTLPPHFSPVTGFLNLTQQYPNAFASLVSSLETGTWLGASPEILVRKNRNNIFQTMALAGTQKLTAGLDPCDAIWRQKEIEEQSMVVRYIISCFKKIRLRDYVETGPRTVVAGNLLHLRSDFCYDLNTGEFPTLTSEMLHLLHPTSAVCGQPKAAALAFLNAEENYDRRYYSGYLGPVNVNNETAIFVNLRCLELRETEAILYAGAGVTADSDPSKEWLETDMKMQTVSAALQLFTTTDDTATGY